MISRKLAVFAIQTIDFEFGTQPKASLMKPHKRVPMENKVFQFIEQIKLATTPTHVADFYPHIL